MPFTFGKLWGEMIVELNREGSSKPHRRGDRLVGRRQGLDAEDPRRRRIPQRQDGDAEDVAATLERHSDEKSKSGALGYMKGIETVKASGKEVVLSR